MKGLTKKQGAVFEFIKSQIMKANRPPTIREIGSQFNMKSTGSVRDVLKALDKKGFVEREPHMARGIKIKAGPGPLSGEIIELPVVGKIAAGTTVDDYQNIEGTLKVDKSMVPEGKIFVVKVKDNAMKDAGISNGDYIFVRKQTRTRSGQIVAVLVDEEVKLRKVSKKGNEVHLLPKNERFKSIMIDAEMFRAAILGIAVGVYRRF